MKPVCETCDPTCKKLTDDISRLKTELAQKSKLLMDFSTLATAQAKRLVVLGASELEGMSRIPSDNDSTIPWSTSIIDGCREGPPGQPVDLGSRSRVHSSSTPRHKLSKHWAVAGGRKAARSSDRPQQQGIQLRNSFSVLDAEEFPPLPRRAPATKRPSTNHLRLQAAVELNSRHRSGDSATPRNHGERDGLPVETARPVSASGGCIPEQPLEAASVSERHGVSSSPASVVSLFVVNSGVTDNSVPRPGGAPAKLAVCNGAYSPNVPVPTSSPTVSNTLIIGDSIVRFVSVKGCETRCFPGTKVDDMNTMIPRILAEEGHESLVVHIGANDIRAAASEQIKEDFNRLMDTLWETGKTIAISGPLPCFNRGDMKYSRLRQLHSWLKERCWYWNIPYIDNFTFFSNRYDLFNRDGVHLNRFGAKLLSANISDTVRVLFSYVKIQTQSP